MCRRWGGGGGGPCRKCGRRWAYGIWWNATGTTGICVAVIHQRNDSNYPVMDVTVMGPFMEDDNITNNSGLQLNIVPADDNDLGV